MEVTSTLGELLLLVLVIGWVIAGIGVVVSRIRRHNAKRDGR